LVNNAGIYPYDLFDDMSFAPWRDVLAIDLDGPFLMCKAFVSMMRARKWVRVVNVSSAEWWLVNPRQTALPLPGEGHLPGAVRRSVGRSPDSGQLWNEQGISTRRVGGSLAPGSLDDRQR